MDRITMGLLCWIRWGEFVVRGGCEEESANVT